YNTGFLSICPADLDYFAWTLPVDETATFIIDGMDTIGTGDLDFFLYEQNGANLGELLGYSTSTDSQSEEIIFTNNTGSDLLVYLEVRAFQPEYSNIYSLSIVSVD
ncbi:hypothetical protein KAI87_04915, partial [Myxococcota bacterium]|nr:hypothetical protein [Myxococcota bacterium]